MKQDHKIENDEISERDIYDKVIKEAEESLIRQRQDEDIDDAIINGLDDD